jgi:formylglycine-generating enzyme required for sulfatase activity
MRARTILSKSAVLASSVVLVSAFVYQRTGGELFPSSAQKSEAPAAAIELLPGPKAGSVARTVRTLHTNWVTTGFRGKAAGEDGDVTSRPSIKSMPTPETRSELSGKFAGTGARQTRDDNGLKTTLVWIPPGDFTMGTPKYEKGHFYDENQVHVSLSRGFWLGQHEVTQAEWWRVMQTTPWLGNIFAKEGNDYPATCVSWDDGMKFCEKLTEQERAAGRLPSGWQYTLPTEAQWEYACRAGTKSRFSFGDDESDLSDSGWWGGVNGEGNAKGEQYYAHTVGQKKANPFRLYDMHGNVSEWCSDYYAENLAGGTDPQGPSEGSNRVFRGGCWGDPARFCRSANRAGKNVTPDYRDGYIGFRIAAAAASRIRHGGSPEEADFGRHQ